jgi:hypothetical protein
MKAELREAGKNLLIPHGQEQQLSGRILETKKLCFLKNTSGATKQCRIERQFQPNKNDAT